MPVDDLDAFVVDFQVLVNVRAILVVEEDLGAFYLTHRRAFAGVFDLHQKFRRGWAVFVRLQVSCVFRTEAKVPSSPESGDDAYVLVLVTSEPGCVFFAFYRTILRVTTTFVIIVVLCRRNTFSAPEILPNNRKHDKCCDNDTTE